MLALAALCVVLSCGLVLHDVTRSARRAASAPAAPTVVTPAVAAAAPGVASPPTSVATAQPLPAPRPVVDGGVLGTFPAVAERPPASSRRLTAAMLLFAITLVVAGLTAVVIYGGLQSLG